MSAALEQALGQEWFSAAELAELRLPGLPGERRNISLMAERERWASRPRKGRGGGVEYHLYSLPLTVRAAVAIAVMRESERPAPRRELQAVTARLSEAKKARAEAKAAALEAVATLCADGTGKLVAMQSVAAQLRIQISTLYSWEKAVIGLPREDWVAALAPRHVGATVEKPCDPQAWTFIRADYLRPERPSFTSCYRRLERVAAEQGWSIPSARTLERRLLALPQSVRTLAREGIEALKKSYPAQERRRDHFHALEAVNADGHEWDVMVRWPDGHVGRPVMIAFQDLFSGKVLSWRIDRTETREAVRLAFGDLVENFGVPDHCWFDNGRSFAAKWLTGGIPNRYRFRVRDDEPDGLMKTMGVQVHWTKPYSGQSKPIERAFGDFARDLAKHPAFAGAYVGNSPVNKPANYGSRAVEFETFLRVVGEGIAEHNARPGRRTHVAQLRSFDEVFAESYAASPIRRAAEWQRRMWLLAAEAVAVSRRDATITLLGNRYWSEALTPFRGQRVTVRFDPQALHDDLHVYRPDGGYLAAVPVIEAAGFNDLDAARRHNEARKRYLKGVRMQLEAETRLSIDQVAALLPRTAIPDPPEAPRVVRMVNGPALAVPPPRAGEQPEDERQMVEAIRRLRVIRNNEGDL